MPRSEARTRILTVGGLDPCGGAGITADVRVALALGVEAATVATCLTAQNRHGFSDLHAVGEPILSAALRAVRDDGPVGAIKVGLAGLPRTLDLVLAFAADHWSGVPVVVDPVLSATSGGLTTSADLEAAYRRALPAITLLTPNRPEAARLFPEGLEGPLRDAGCAVLLKGGHDGPPVPGAPVGGEVDGEVDREAAGDAEPADREMVEDQLWTGGGRTTIFRHPRLEVGPVHGTGCALATAIAVGLARGDGLEAACRAGIDYLGRCLLATPRSPDGLPVPLAIRLPPAG